MFICASGYSYSSTVIFFAKVIKKKYIYSYVEKKLTIKMSLHNIMNIKILELNVYSSNN